MRRAFDLVSDERSRRNRSVRRTFRGSGSFLGIRFTRGATNSVRMFWIFFTKIQRQNHFLAAKAGERKISQKKKFRTNLQTRTERQSSLDTVTRDLEGGSDWLLWTAWI